MTDHSHVIRTTHTPCTLASFRSVVANLFDPRDWFHGRQFSHRGVGMGQGNVSDGDWQMELGSLTLCSLPAVQPDS